MPGLFPYVISKAGLWGLTRQVANECRVLAYKEYPYRRPGTVKGSPARYEFFKDCVAKRSNPEAPQLEPKKQ